MYTFASSIQWSINMKYVTKCVIQGVQTKYIMLLILKIVSYDKHVFAKR